uniref:Uncharacterized protein n=1 Tax=Phytophthora ramorum TaxID=164328 RepID=H3HBR9_PHYRM
MAPKRSELSTRRSSQGGVAMSLEPRPPRELLKEIGISGKEVVRILKDKKWLVEKPHGLQQQNLYYVPKEQQDAELTQSTHFFVGEGELYAFILKQGGLQYLLPGEELTESEESEVEATQPTTSVESAVDESSGSETVGEQRKWKRRKKLSTSRGRTLVSPRVKQERATVVGCGQQAEFSEYQSSLTARGWRAQLLQDVDVHLLRSVAAVDRRQRARAEKKKDEAEIHQELDGLVCSIRASQDDLSSMIESIIVQGERMKIPDRIDPVGRIGVPGFVSTGAGSLVLMRDIERYLLLFVAAVRRYQRARKTVCAGEATVQRADLRALQLSIEESKTELQELAATIDAEARKQSSPAISQETSHETTQSSSRPTDSEADVGTDHDQSSSQQSVVSPRRLEGVQDISSLATMSEHQHLHHDGNTYGAISPVKRAMQQLHSPLHSPQHHNQHAVNFEPECGDLSSTTKILHGERSRDRLSRFLDHSSFGVGLDIFLVLVSIVFTSSYIANTYIASNDMPFSLWVTDIVCAGLTLWIDISYWRFVYPMRFAMCYIEAKAVLSRCHGLMSPVQQFAMVCYLQLTIIIAVAAGVIQIAETADAKYANGDLGEWTFFNSFFNSVLAFVTIQSPPADNPLAKFCVGALVLVLILVVPYQVSQILALGSSFSAYELATHTPSPTSKHIILSGDLTPSRIDHFFREVFHDDHDLVDINVVVLSEEEPATSLIALLMDPFFEKRASYIQGSLLDVDDAQRAACGSADAIFILARRVGGETPASSDHRALMRVLAARREAPKARVFAQLHLSANRGLVADLGVSNVLCFSEVMHSLLGQNCVCPGFSTFMYSLTSTSSYDSSSDYDEPPAADASWEDRYLHGSSHEVYSVGLPSASVIFGKTFSEVASIAYAQCSGVIVFAITTAQSSKGSGGKLLLNPGDSYTCVGEETVFVIAQDRRQASAVTDMQAGDAMPLAWTSQRQGSKSRHLFGDDEITSPQRRQSRFVNWQAGAVSPASSFSRENRGTWKPDVDDDDPLAVQTNAAVVPDVASLHFQTGHIVVCVLSPSSFPHHLEYLIGPLRVRALRQHRPVVIVTPTLPDVDDYEHFQRFLGVHFVVGDPFRQSTLRRAGVHKAFRIVLMGAEGEVSDAGTSELLQDAACIALHKTITSFVGPAQAPRIITELVNRANVHFVAQNLSVSGWFPLSECDSAAASTSSLELARNFAVSPAFAAGLTYSTSLCDSLLINQFFNARIKNILREFIFASWTDGGVGTLPSTPATAGGFGEAVVSPAMSSSSAAGVQRSSLFAVEVPLDFVGRTFEFVFHYLLSSDGMLVIGLYRCRPDAMLHSSSSKSAPRARIEVPEGERSVPFGYVYVNPQPHEVLSGNDLLYVLSDIQPCWAEADSE